MTQVQNHQEVTDLKVLLMKCFVAESDLACFLMEKANSTDLSLDDTFKLKHLADRVKRLIRQVQASDEKHDQDDKRPPDKLPVYLVGGSPNGPTHREAALRMVSKGTPKLATRLDPIKF